MILGKKLLASLSASLSCTRCCRKRCGATPGSGCTAARPSCGTESAPLRLSPGKPTKCILQQLFGDATNPFLQRSRDCECWASNWHPDIARDQLLANSRLWKIFRLDGSSSCGVQLVEDLRHYHLAFSPATLGGQDHLIQSASLNERTECSGGSGTSTNQPDTMLYQVSK